MQFQRVEETKREGMEESSGQLLDLFLKVPLISGEILTSRSLTLLFLLLSLSSSTQRLAVGKVTISSMRVGIT